MTPASGYRVSSVNADIDALREFHAALVRFRYAQRDMIDRGDHRVAAVRASLAEKAGRWRADLGQRQAELDDCRYRAVRATTDDNLVDCSDLARAVALAEERVEHISQWQQRVEEQAGAYRGVAGPYRELLDHDLPRAEAQLLELIAKLEAARRV